MFLEAPGRREEWCGENPLCRLATSPRQLAGEKKPAVIIVGFVDHLGFFPLQGGIKGG